LRNMQSATGVAECDGSSGTMVLSKGVTAMSIDDILSKTIHVIVLLAGKCPNCGRYNEQKIFDYGKKTVREFEQQAENTGHPVEPLNCRACKDQYSPEYIIHRDMIRDSEIARIKVPYGNEMDNETYQLMKKGHDRRYEIFRGQEEAFWKAYCEFALSHWPKILQELRREEIEAGLSGLGLSLPVKRSETGLRREVTQKVTSNEDKVKFWRAANEEFIYKNILDLGPLSWQPEKDATWYGPNRVRFVLLHFPLGEDLESLRTEYIGRVVKKEKGDNAFLFRRISQLTDELHRTRRRNTDFFHQIERMKREIAARDQKIHELSTALRAARENITINQRHPDDIRKIHELKSFVNELISEIRRLEAALPKKEPSEVESEAIEPVKEPLDEPVSLEALRGKTIGVIGGIRNQQVEKEGIRILTHHGDKLDPAFYQTLEQADVVVVIPRLVSHSGMWAAKAHAIDWDKPIYFERAVNLNRILESVAHKQKKEDNKV
jgi:hypothetical protein